MADDVLNKADSLMRRHRAFVAGEPAAAGVSPAPTSAKAAEHEDLPVLTEVVEASGQPDPGSTAESVTNIEAMLRDRLAAVLPQQREVLRQELALWLDEQLPPLVMRVLDGVTDQLVAQINTQARMTLLPRLQAVLDSTDSPSGT